MSPMPQNPTTSPSSKPNDSSTKPQSGNRAASVAHPQLTIESVDHWPATKEYAKIRMLSTRIHEVQAKALAAGDVVTHEWCSRFASLQADFEQFAARAAQQKRGVVARFRSHFGYDDDDLEAVAALTNRIDDLFLALLFGRKADVYVDGDEGRDSDTTADSVC